MGAESLFYSQLSLLVVLTTHCSHCKSLVVITNLSSELLFTGWQMSQLASIPENSDQFYSLTDLCPQTPPPHSTSTLPAEALPNILLTRTLTPGSTKRRKYSVDPHIKLLANQLVPDSTKPTRVQELGRSIKDVWQKRFTPKRILNELYMPGVLYATRARFVRTEQDFWTVSQGGLQSKGFYTSRYDNTHKMLCDVQILIN